MTQCLAWPRDSRGYTGTRQRLCVQVYSEYKAPLRDLGDVKPRGRRKAKRDKQNTLVGRVGVIRGLGCCSVRRK